MGFFTLLFRERKPSAPVAKERLQILLAHERASRDAPEFLPVLQRELIDVVRRYVEIRDDMIRVTLGKSGEASMLEIDVEFEGAGLKFATPNRPRARATFEPG
jgi:cell division topological specificity factor